MQVIALLGGLFDAQHIRTALIVVPKVVMTNWEKEFKKWRPDTLVRFYHAAGSRERDLSAVVKKGGVLITTYGTWQCFVVCLE